MKPNTQGGIGNTRHRQDRTKAHLSWNYLALLHWGMEASLDGFRFFDFLVFGVALFRVSHDYLIMLKFFGGIFGEFLEFLNYMGLNSYTSWRYLVRDRMHVDGSKMSHITAVKVSTPLKFLNKASIR